ncbi:MAG: 2-C-methyl-D-erythritol 4-phosphate cytidylyltransferase [Cytophagales bacterium]|nr:MAG: 2-C-methyl-D-erythritol 4-phosphate cytidylyltransferase [Cytophagales bacterium]
MSKYAIIVAGGSGTRMQSDIPKQFMLLNGKPVLMHTIEVFTQCAFPVEIFLVLPENHIEFWNQLCTAYSFMVPHQVVKGGNSRCDSVNNGLAMIKTKEGLVAIHDGVRPLVSVEIIEASFYKAETSGNAVASVALKDSIRSVREDKNEALPRSQFRLMQTPQTFELNLIKKAYLNANKEVEFTDDASVLESIGGEINLINGSYDNLKITTPEDLLIASAILSNRENPKN